MSAADTCLSVADKREHTRRPTGPAHAPNGARAPLASGRVCRQTSRIALGLRAGQKVPTLRGAMPREATARQPLCADIDGFSLHAAVRVEANDRTRLEQLCRYITRPALSGERVQLNAAGQVVLAQDAVARRHHAPGHEPAGVHAATGRAGDRRAPFGHPCRGRGCT